MLAIDIGNSRVKWALFESESIVAHDAFVYSDESFEACFEASGLPLNVAQLVISHVAGAQLKSRLINWLEKQGCKNYFFATTGSSQLHVANAYSKPASLGVDRWLAIIAAYNHPLRKSNEGVCVIDCGTAITLDLINHEGAHLGGMIVPGYRTMQLSLVNDASDIQYNVKNQPDDIGSVSLPCSTADAIEQGVAKIIINGILGIVNGFAERLHGKMHCVLTGGDAGWVSASLDIKHIHEPFLVLQGLHMVARENTNSEDGC